MTLRIRFGESRAPVGPESGCGVGDVFEAARHPHARAVRFPLTGACVLCWLTSCLADWVHTVLVAADWCLSDWVHTMLVAADWCLADWVHTMLVAADWCLLQAHNCASCKQVFDYFVRWQQQPGRRRYLIMHSVHQYLDHALKELCHLQQHTRYRVN